MKVEPVTSEGIPSRIEPVREASTNDPFAFPHAWESSSNAVVLDQKKCLIRYTEDEGSGVVVTLGTSTCLFQREREWESVFYYEVEVLGLAVFSTVTVGFSNVDDETHGMLPGKYAGSCGLSSRGECSANGRTMVVTGKLVCTGRIDMF